VNIPLKALEQKAVANMLIAPIELSIHFFEVLNVMGFPGSFGIQVTIKGSEAVPAPSYLCSRTAGVTRAWSVTSRQCGILCSAETGSKSVAISVGINELI
jgi:hypothetical protein